MTTKEQVAAMAYSTGERLKSSAVELFRGLESSLQNREQLEVALAKMFGSCTGDFKSSRNGHRAGDNDGLPHRSSSLSYSEPNVPQRTILGAAPLRREVSNSSSRRKSSKASAARKKRHSGSSGASVTSHSSSRSSDSSSGSHGRRPTNQRNRRERRQARADYGEHIYAQLFMDDQKRAAQAVSSLRETAVVTARAKPPAANTTSPAAVTSPFPASSPPRNKATTTTTTDPKIATPLSSNELTIPQTLTFDDGISAITHHTLEAMEERVTRARSNDSSLWSSLKESKTPPLPTTGSGSHRASPLNHMSRVRSAQSKASRMSRQSKTSHTTHTSDSSSFQNMWQQEEQRYWHGQVEQDSRRSRRSRNESVQKTVDNTLATMESSFSDVWGSPLRHPHEVSNNANSSPLTRDPDRIGAVFVVPHTEMAEI